MTEVRLLDCGDAAVLDRVADGVFDQPIDAACWAEFLADKRHHLAVAIDENVVVGFASGVHYVHPDKLPQMFINEVGVAPMHRQRGIARRLIDTLVARASELECTEAWVLTHAENAAACRLYESAGAVTPAEKCVMYTIPV